MTCTYDPAEMAGAPIGMFHCPECGEMVIAGMPHPIYDILDLSEEDPLNDAPSGECDYAPDYDDDLPF